ncbi:unnamed protein product [Phytomonas sp. Hart1]|nr:unnamed protein product [Phytomonas sp. Hart1]|eukprot:CCW66472.1 unnamed protein product [Phytomonas sp. isolate Hart1]
MESAVDQQYFANNISKSLKRLPRWYQIGALCGVLIVIYLHDTFFISWLVMNLHNSLGTAWIWYPEYQTVLTHLSFKERLCFTLYGVGLGIIVVLLYKVFCQERFKIGSPLVQLFPDRKGLTVLMCVLLCLIEMLRMQEVITECFTEATSIASIALKELGKGKSNHSRSKYGLHFVIQMELLGAFLFRVLPGQLMAMLIAMAYRLFRDIPLKIHVAVRWYMVTLTVVYAVWTVVSAVFSRTKPTPSSWAMIGWSAFFLGTVNYLYGPLRRAGMVVAISSSCTITKTIRGLVMCMALRSIISLLALTLLVSVHVVELITIWFMVMLLMLWVPAIVDSCSLEGIVFVTGLFSILLYLMNLISTTAAFRLGLMVALGWLNAALLYNLTVNTFHTRYAGIGVMLWLLLWLVSYRKNLTPPFGRNLHKDFAITNVLDLESLSAKQVDEAVNATMPVMDTILGRKIQWMCDVAELRVPLDKPVIWISRFTESNKGSGTFYYVIFQNLCTLIVLVFLLTLLKVFQGPEVRSGLHQAELFLVNTGFLIRKIARSIVTTFCVFSFFASWWTLHHFILPYFAPIMPSMVSHVISGVFGCITLGALMDMKDTMYEGILQILGLIDPVEYTEENSS